MFGEVVNTVLSVWYIFWIETKLIKEKTENYNRKNINQVQTSNYR